MSRDVIEVFYNLELENLENLLKTITRPGDFAMFETCEIPLPKIEIQGMGLLSFPLLPMQVKEMIHKATQAPYGRGKETIIDTSIRNTWQLPSEDILITGKSWQTHFQSILTTVQEKLGCLNVSVRAELYKLLIYEKGGFFLPHRDSEKCPGMFGTLVISLPSFHTGGELIVYHANEKKICDLSHAESSELAFAAFYADCEHEILPITEGYRVCLVYNLIQSQSLKQKLIPPIYSNEIAKISDVLQSTFNDTDAPVKIAWLLEHQYSEAELSFKTLKNTDAAVANALMQATLKADCTLHLGIVHITESGAAEPDDWDNIREDDSFEAVEVFDRYHFIDNLIDIEDKIVLSKEIPLAQDELIPFGSLTDEEPDESRLTEATGNAGVEFERAYHRAVLVIWPKKNEVKIFLQGGLSFAINYLAQNLEKKSTNLDEIASCIINQPTWQSSCQFSYTRDENGSNRKQMLKLLNQIQNPHLIEHFITNVVIPNYTGIETDELIASYSTIPEIAATKLFPELFCIQMGKQPNHCLRLVIALLQNSQVKHYHKFFISSFLDTIDQLSFPYFLNDLLNLWMIFENLGEKNGIDRIVSLIINKPSLFPSLSFIIPLLEKISSTKNTSFQLLWDQAAFELLHRSKLPPIPPKNWKQPVTVKCNCDDCSELKTFQANPTQQVCEFRKIQNRRLHLEDIIKRQCKDLRTYTERKGSPHALICTKTRESYETLCKNYKTDIIAMKTLISLSPSPEPILLKDLIAATEKII
ncbi:MAG: 2OG-Fe(II) oxygenase [Thaumarchaeota archaeon]|nr:2OG-Fe(II) oxygenase [Nitrososphaerota archaeon]